MTQDQDDMAEFMNVFNSLERWGPGSEKETLKALTLLPVLPNCADTLLEIGCGKGLATQVLARHTQAHITATDTEPAALISVEQKMIEAGLQEKVKVVAADMAKLPFGANAFGLIWAEASAYILGVEQALEVWKPLIKPNGFLVFSDLVLTTNEPSTECLEYFQSEYPDIQSIETRRQQIERAGYRLLNDFSYEKASWDNYYLPLQKRVFERQAMYPEAKALTDLQKEIDFYFSHGEEFGYQMFIASKDLVS